MRPVAVKVIRPEYSESEDFREMFLELLATPGRVTNGAGRSCKTTAWPPHRTT